MDFPDGGTQVIILDNRVRQYASTLDHRFAGDLSANALDDTTARPIHFDVNRAVSSLPHYRPPLAMFLVLNFGGWRARGAVSSDE